MFQKGRQVEEKQEEKQIEDWDDEWNKAELERKRKALGNLPHCGADPNCRINAQKLASTIASDPVKFGEGALASRHFFTTSCRTLRGDRGLF